MKEILDILDAYKKADTQQHKLALATVIHVEGSSYRRAGARMLIRDNGEWTGGISGGCLEGDALKKAHHCMARNKVEVVRYDTSTEDEEQIGVGLGCEGIIDVLLSPINPEEENNPIRILESCIDSRQPQILLTIIQSDQPGLQAGKMYKYTEHEGELNAILPQEALQDIARALNSGKSAVKHYSGLSVFIEILQPAIQLVLFGGNYDIYPLLRISKELGWKASVVMNPAKANRKVKELADTIYPKNATVPYDEYTAFILMAHDYKTDKENLRMALQTEVPYIGMLGPVKRRNKSLDELTAEGHQFSQQQLDRLYNPVGLDIGATTPEEIALAILAEVKAHFAERQGQPLRERAGYIHERE